jgi:hypothetical protein
MHNYFHAFQLRCESQTLDKCRVFIEEHWQYDITLEVGKIN